MSRNPVYFSAHPTLQDRGFLYGDGVFTSIRVEDGEPLHIKQHLEKMRKGALYLGIDPLVCSALAVHQFLEEVEATTGVWRLKMILTGGSDGSLNLEEGRKGNLFFKATPYEPRKELETLVRYPYPIESPLASYKTLSYLSRLHVRQYAMDRGADDAITVNSQGYLLEASTSNIFWIVDDELLTPDPRLPLYFGVGLQAYIAEHPELKVVYVHQRWEEIPKTASLFLINALSGPMRCSI